MLSYFLGYLDDAAVADRRFRFQRVTSSAGFHIRKVSISHRVDVSVTYNEMFFTDKYVVLSSEG